MTCASLAGRTVLITGASSGIGAHLARVLAEHGAQVIATARRRARLDQLVDELSAAGLKALAVEADVTDEASVKAAFDRAEETFGTVDTVIANAGLSDGGRSTDVSPAQIRAVIETNLLGVYLTVREGAKRMIANHSRASERGRIVMLGSITARMTGQGDAAYAASKAGVEHLGRQFAREWIRQGINVNAVQPGYIRTELSGDWFETEGGKAQLAGWHRRRFMPLDVLDDTILYLCSDAARYVTGATFTIDDGQSL